MCAQRSDLQRRDRQFQIIDRAGGGSEVKNVIDFLFGHKNEIRNVMFDELEILVPSQVPDIRGISRDQIVDGNNPMTFRQQSIAQM
jgi:hypothetical protein